MALGVSAGDYTAPLTTTWSVQGGSNTAGVFTDTETHYYNNWGTSGWAAQAYTQFSLENIPVGESVTKATYTVTLNCSRGTRTADVTVLPVGANPADYQVLKAKADCGTQVATYSDITTSYATKTIDVTEQVKAALANGDSYIIMAISNGAAGGNIYGKAGATPPTLSISTVDASNMSGYIVKYMYNDTEIQKADTLPGVKGEAITLTNSQKANIYTEDIKYIYASDDASAFTVGEDTVTVTVNFREAAVYDYTYNAKLGDSEYLLKTGQSFEGDEVTVYYPKYMVEGTTLYTSGAYPFKATFTPTSTNYKEYKQYNVAEENSNVVLYSEAEDISGVIPFEDGNTEIRMSGGAVGEADSVVVAILKAGKYTLTSSTRSGETKFYVDGENILTLSSTGAVTDATSSEFIIKEDGTSVMAKNVLTSNHKNYFDYVLIRRTGEYTEEPGVKYSYTLTSDITALGNYAVTGGSIDLLSGSLEKKNELYGQKSGSAITAQVNMERKLKVNDCIKLTMFCASSNKATGFDITKDGTTSLVYFQLPSGYNKANKYTVEYIVKESDVDLIGVDTFSIKRITAADNLYLTGVEVEVLEKKAPEFTVQPVGKNVKTYEYVKIPVKATGFPEPTYQWYVDGEPVDYDSEFGIYIGEPKTYTVYVTATNSEGSTNSEVIELKALDDITVNGNSFVVSTDMEVADGLSFIAEYGKVILLENGNFSVQRADSTEAPAGYSAIISGTVNPTVNVNDNIATGVCYGVEPLKNGVFTFVGKFNAGKAINIMKFTYGVEAKGTAGSLQADVETEPVSFKVGETEYPSGSSFDANYNGPISFDVDNQHGYIIYATGSKIGMYGFDFTEATAVDGVSEAQESVKKEGKFIENGQIVILKAGKKFNAAGAQIK